MKQIIIPDAVTNLGAQAFQYCTNLTNIVIGSGLSEISDSAFYGASSLTCLRIPETVRNIGNDSFAECVNLIDLTIGPGTTNIGMGAFFDCNRLQIARIPATVSNISSSAFGYCASLTNVLFAGNAPTVDSFAAFNGAVHAIIFYLPGTSGWGISFGGRSSVLWNPTILTDDPSFGVNGESFDFAVTGNIGVPVAIYACTNLADPVWLPLQIATLQYSHGQGVHAGIFRFSDAGWVSHPARYYRVCWP